MFEIVTSDDSEKNPISTMFMSPSLTTYDGGHPAYRIFQTDENYGVEDFWTFISYGNDKELNDKNSDPKWKLEYQASKFYDGKPDSRKLQGYLMDAFVDQESFEKFNEIHWKSLLENYAFQFDSKRNGTGCFEDIRCKREFLCPYTSQKSFEPCKLFDDFN